MAAGHQATATRSQNSSDNVCRWDGKTSGHYEVWFLTLNHRKSRRGFWFRYTLDSPVVRIHHQHPAPVLELWAGYFDRNNCSSNFLITQKLQGPFSFDERSGVAFQCGGAELSGTGSRGIVESGGHRISWSLEFDPNPVTYHHAGSRIARLVKTSSFVCSPNIDVKFTGTILVDGEEIRLENEPGCQAHLWRRKHVDEWVWAHSNAFEKSPGTVFEGLAARPLAAGRMMPPIYSLLLRHRGEEHRFFRLRFADPWQRRLGIGYWAFSATNPNLHIEGVAQCRMKDMLQVEYRDPDGEPVYCTNSEVANLKIRLFRRVHTIRWRHVETISAFASAHLEHACRRTDPQVRPALPDVETQSDQP